MFYYVNCLKTGMIKCYFSFQIPERTEVTRVKTGDAASDVHVVDMNKDQNLILFILAVPRGFNRVISDPVEILG